jgi:hypothetical protein
MALENTPVIIKIREEGRKEKTVNKITINFIKIRSKEYFIKK